MLILAACAPSGDDPARAFRRGDYARSAALLESRAAQGDVAAQNALGVLYYAGVGVRRDYGVALNWFERAALAGNPHARRHLGSMFREGLGTPKDDFRAFGWYDAARRAGHPGARAYMEWTALVVGWNQQGLGRRIVAADLKAHRVSHRGDPAEREDTAAGDAGP